jgi:hypothetical protein
MEVITAIEEKIRKHRQHPKNYTVDDPTHGERKSQWTMGGDSIER